MSHHKDGHRDDVERTEGGEREGFLDKVKDFFTGGDEHGRDAAPEERELDAEQGDLAEGQSETDSVASAGSGGGGVSESGWDGSDEPPELTVPQNEAVAAYSEASEEDDGATAASAASAETGGVGEDDLSGREEAEPLEDTGNAAVADYSDASGDDVASESAEPASGSAGAEGDEGYESRHGSGVDDSGVLADAPLEARDDEAAERETRAVDTAETSDDGSGEEEAREEEERARREEEFAREHDPATHDLEAGEEFRQRGDWTAAEHDGPQVQEADGTVHDPDDDASGASEPDADEGGAGEGERSRHDESGSDVAALTGVEGIEDGGHGWGSAAPMAGGRTPLGHPVKAWHDTMTFVLPGEDGYEGSDPHEWFVDAETAQRAGFRHAHGG